MTPVRWFAAFLLTLLLLGIGSQCAMAQSGRHGDGHAQQHDIYQRWSPPNNPKTSCCNAVKEDGTGDCRPTRAFVDDEGRWQAWTGVEWLIVPADRVLPPNYAGDGRSHLCSSPDGFVFCFTAGEIRG